MYNFKKYYYCMLLILVVAIPNTKAQDRKSMIKIADEHYYRFEYKQAAVVYQTLVKKDKPDTNLLKKLGNSYRQINDYDKAAECYRIVASGQEATPADILIYGEILKNLGRYVEAKKVFEHHPQRDLPSIAQRIVSCDSAIKWLNHSTSDRVNNLAAVNTSASEWGAVLTDQKKLIFTSDSLRESALSRKMGKNSRVIYRRTNRPYLKLYQHNGLSDQSGDGVTEFSALLNDFNYHVGPVIFDSDRSIAYFTVTSIRKMDKPQNDILSRYDTRRLEIFSSKLTNGIWGKPTPFPFNSGKFSVGHPAVTADGNILYFTSDMPGGRGKTDIWFCEKLPDGGWSQPVNCGSEINTAEEEGFPTINNGLLYYSSKGHIGMGGFDIFSAEGNRMTWSVPQNLKSPLNSPGDDFYLTMQDGENGYFSSNRKGGLGDDDIYTIVREKKILKNDLRAVTVPVIVRNPEPRNLKPEIKRPKSGERFVIYTDFDKANVRGDASGVLDSVVDLLIKYPDMRIRLSSYTDSRGKFEYNLALSKKRAAAAKAYLIGYGVSAARIIANGFGETNLVIKCPTDAQCSETDHQKNRRTEILVLP